MEGLMTMNDRTIILSIDAKFALSELLGRIPKF